MAFYLFGGKRISKKVEKGVGAVGPTASLSARSPARPTPPPPLPCADAPALLHPTLATWWPYVGDVAAAARPTGITRSGRRPTPQTASILSPPHSLFFPTRERSSSSGLHGAIVGRSSAARRRPCHRAILRAKATAVLAFAALSPYARSTEVKAIHEPAIARQSSPDLVGVLRRAETLPPLLCFACS